MGHYHATVRSLLLNGVTLPPEWESVINKQREALMNVKIAQRNGVPCADRKGRPLGRPASARSVFGPGPSRGASVDQAIAEGEPPPPSGGVGQRPKKVCVPKIGPLPPPPPLNVSPTPNLMHPPPPRTDSECASGCTWSTARATARLRDGRPSE